MLLPSRGTIVAVATTAAVLAGFGVSPSTAAFPPDVRSLLPAAEVPLPDTDPPLVRATGKRLGRIIHTTAPLYFTQGRFWEEYINPGSTRVFVGQKFGWVEASAIPPRVQTRPVQEVSVITFREGTARGYLKAAVPFRVPAGKRLAMYPSVSTSSAGRQVVTVNGYKIAGKRTLVKVAATEPYTREAKRRVREAMKVPLNAYPRVSEEWVEFLKVNGVAYAPWMIVFEWGHNVFAPAPVTNGELSALATLFAGEGMEPLSDLVSVTYQGGGCLQFTSTEEGVVPSSSALTVDMSSGAVTGLRWGECGDV